MGNHLVFKKYQKSPFIYLFIYLFIFWNLLLFIFFGTSFYFNHRVEQTLQLGHS